MSEVKRSEDVVQAEKREIVFTSGNLSARFNNESATFNILTIADVSNLNRHNIHNKKTIPDLIAVLQAVQNELEPQKKDASADERRTNKIKFTTDFDGVERDGYAWLILDSRNELTLRVSDKYEWGVITLNKKGELYRNKCVVCDTISATSIGQIKLADTASPPKHPLITAADWRDYFTNKADMMSYNVERARAEFDNRIKHIYKLGWQNGKAEIANYISMKKWIAIANGNEEYMESDSCGYCFAFRCKYGCIYQKFYYNLKPNGDKMCTLAEPDEMIRRFQNPELLTAIKEYDNE